MAFDLQRTTSDFVWPWLGLVLLGAYHGVNPAMGWLFAVALGLQERSRRALLQALGPIALGHAVSIALTVALVDVLQVVSSPAVVRGVSGVALVLFGAYKLLRPRAHPRWVGMRVSLRELVAWSFLMATAHGAGLMLFPLLLGLSSGAHSHGASLAEGAGAVLVHTASMLVVMSAMAILVYEKLGLALLRSAWVNLDLVWAVAVIAAGALTLFT